MFFNPSQAIVGGFFNDQTAAFIKKIPFVKNMYFGSKTTGVRVLDLKLFI